MRFVRYALWIDVSRTLSNIIAIQDITLITIKVSLKLKTAPGITLTFDIPGSKDLYSITDATRFFFSDHTYINYHNS